MGKESGLGNLVSLENTDFFRAVTAAGLSKKVTGEILKAFIAAGNKLVNDYYYFQDADNPVANDYRIFSNGIYLDFERYSGTAWERQFRMGGSAFVDRFLDIGRDANADVLVSDSGEVRNLVRSSTWSDGTVMGDIDGEAFIVTSDRVRKVKAIEAESWKVIQGTDTANSTGTSFYVDNTTLNVDGFISSKIKLKSPAFPAGIKAQLKIFRQSDLVNPVWKNVTDEELANGFGADISVSTGEVLLKPRFYGIGNTAVRLVINTSEEVTLQGSTTDGTDIYFESFDAEVDFIEITDETNVKTQYEAFANTNAFTDAEKTKLTGIAAGAEVNVQSDWDQANTGADDYIKNKPAIGAVLPSIDYTLTSHIDSLDVSYIYPNGLLFVDSTANLELRSLAGGLDKQTITVVNLSLKDLKIKNESGTSQMVRVEGNADRTMSKYGGLSLVYNSSKGYWYVSGIIS